MQNNSTTVQIIPFLHSKSFDTRTAASVSLSQIFSLVPVWQPESKPPVTEEQSLPAPDFPNFSVQELISQGKLLLASSGKEFVKPAGILASPAEVKKARKAAMSRLGLDFLDEDDLEIEKELADEMDVDIEGEMDAVPVTVTVKSEENPDPECPPSLSPMDIETKPKRENTSPPTTRSVTPAEQSPTTPDAPEADLSALSARERNRLKRKRKPGNTAFVAPPPQSAGSKYTAAPVAGNSHKCAPFLSSATELTAPQSAPRHY